MAAARKPGGKVIPVVQVDAFTAAAFGGNPAAVCLLPPSALPLDDDTRQRIAAEMNLPETSFVEPCSSSAAEDNHYTTASSFNLRWFTPTLEVPLCGHATLAAAAALFQVSINRSDCITFHTKSGELRVSRVAAAPSSEGGVGSQQLPWLAMDLPLLAPEDAVPTAFDRGSALVEEVAGGLPVECVRWSAAIGYLLVVLANGVSRIQVEALTSAPAALVAATPAGGGPRGIILTAADQGEHYDFVSRFFSPWMGIDEDPVTGSAHCVLAPYWGERLGKTQMWARQCSKRGGDLRIELRAESNVVQLQGQAVVVMEGQLYL